MNRNHLHNFGLGPRLAAHSTYTPQMTGVGTDTFGAFEF
jgi:hypothetical protein